MSHFKKDDIVNINKLSPTTVTNTFHLSTKNGVLIYRLLHYDCTLHIPLEICNRCIYIHNITTYRVCIVKYFTIDTSS